MSNQFKPFVGSLLPLLIFKKFATLPADIWASPFIYFQENFQPPCFFTYLDEKLDPTRLLNLKKPTLLLEPPLLLET